MANTIGFDPVAFSIDGGRHPGSLLRLLAYAATSGEKGVIQPDDWKVTQTPAASKQVALATGAGVIPVGDSSIDSQVYIANASAESRLDVDQTFGVARQDMVVVWIYDPEFTSENAPPTAGDKPNWQYVRPGIIKGVPAGAKTFDELNIPGSAVEVARIELPPNTTNITTGMIKDLRQIARPRTKVDQQTVTHPEDYSQQLISGPWGDWATSADRDVKIPVWAKQVIVEVFISGVKVNVGPTYGGLRARLGLLSSQYSVVTREIGYDSNTPAENNYDRTMTMIADTLTIPDQIRGTTQPFGIEGRKYGGSTSWEIDEETAISTKLTFVETIA